MSVIAAGEAIAVRRRGIPGLRGTGWVGHVCAGIIVFALVIAVIGPHIAPYDPNFIQLRYAYVGPVGDHYLGFDSRGRDLLSRLLTGSQTAVFGAVAVAGISVIVGTVLAIATAWRGGWFDNTVGALLDVLFAFPGILIAVMAAAVFGPSLKTAVIALSVAYTPYIARVLRGAALRERAQQYVSALEVQGLGAIAICLRHLVPNIIGLVVAQGTILFGYAMVDLAAISFIGLGVQSPTADWGVMVSEGRAGVLTGYPMESLSAGLCIVVVVVAVNLLGERLADRAERR
jgi:peptide/nickel transport system permease protein